MTQRVIKITPEILKKFIVQEVRKLQMETVNMNRSWTSDTEIRKGTIVKAGENHEFYDGSIPVTGKVVHVYRDGTCMVQWRDTGSMSREDPDYLEVYSTKSYPDDEYTQFPVKPWM